MILRSLNLTNRSSHNRFQDGTSGIVKKMNLINDEKTNELSIRSISTLSRHNVPFLGCCDNDLSLRNLSLGELHVTRKFLHRNTVHTQTFSEIHDTFLHESFHGCDVHNLEFALIDRDTVILVQISSDRFQHGKYRNVRFTRSGGSTQQQIVR